MTALPLDPLMTVEGSGTIAAAATWLEQVMLGTSATIVATLAVAAVGVLLFTGRIEWRRGTKVILGCFILFGASTIASGLAGLAEGNTAPPPANISPPPPTPTPEVRKPYDPYAGASVPSQ